MQFIVANVDLIVMSIHPKDEVCSSWICYHLLKIVFFVNHC
jgi:hypothetical protein